jgi:hypothetical protein
MELKLSAMRNYLQSYNNRDMFTLVSAGIDRFSRRIARGEKSADRFNVSLCRGRFTDNYHRKKSFLPSRGIPFNEAGSRRYARIIDIYALQKEY